jgi:DUF971 family protein
MKMKSKPTGIKVEEKDRKMTITWDDGHISVYSYTLLRNGCPCAECRGGHENMGPDPDPEVFNMLPENTPRTNLADIETVGSYALTPYWEDGHQYGIYNWDYLRKLCSCSECR